MAMLSPFFECCVSNKWIQSNSARNIMNPKGREMSSRASEQQVPLTDDEIEKMYETCQRDGKTGKHNGMATMLPISSALAGFSGGMSGSRTRELLY